MRPSPRRRSASSWRRSARLPVEQMNRRGVLAGGAALALSASIARAAVTPPPASAQDIADLGQIDEVLQARVAALANERGLAGVGFAACDLAKGRAAFVRGGELFPLQSVGKLPVAVAVLHMVQMRQLRFERTIDLSRPQIAPGTSPLADGLRRAPVRINTRRLLEAMLINSDNTAADGVMKLAGGPAAIQRKLKELDVDGLRPDRVEPY